MADQRHSEAVLSDLRDAWWNDDFLQLLARRLGLAAYQRVADIGCGHGHWGQRLLPVLAPTAQMDGVDREPDWVQRSAQRAERLGFGARCHYQVAAAEALPFTDASFDLATCQTLLMHVAAPAEALHEMLRILRPGGRLLLSEPSNLAQLIAPDSVNRLLTPQQIADLAHLFAACRAGRERLGHGDDSVAEVLPRLLCDLPVEDIRVYQNDRASWIQPPYDELTRAQLAEETRLVDLGVWLGNEEKARELFEAGGGAPSSFATVYRTFKQRNALFKEQVAHATYSRAGGGAHFIVAATRIQE